ncbi:LD-carboxypeptidase [Massilia horti]|uniref:Muramoyltetrapeptide carboxypeptidase n=1 Tax=Massilia horti TaxID=2562153 RepID=A0A4Y9TA10_9BURK|nr:LD-carboxypeptidase [Massilia horti]TFW35371.1 muramoyltetrapeptide carboxypeptidase [Massilia horti]
MITPNIGIAVAATGGAAPDGDAVERAIARLRAQGCVVHSYYEHQKVHQRFGGTDSARLAQLHAAATDPQVQVVMALRGQYGITRLLPHIDYDLLAASGKVFVGYSDITALHMALMAKTGAISYAGPMICDDFTNPEPVDYTMEQFWSCLAGPTHAIESDDASAGNPECEAQGTIWGGNLAMFVSLLGTEYFPHIEGGILFFEDVSEHPYRVERMLLQLMQSGVLARQKALVLGDFSRYRLSPHDNGYDFDVMLAYLRNLLPIPVLVGLPFGHIPRRATIPFGAQAEVVSRGGRFTLTLSDYPTVHRA